MNPFVALISTLVMTSNITSSATLFAKNSFNVSREEAHLSSMAPNLNKQALRLALIAYQNAEKKGQVRKPVLTVIDYSVPSNKQRMYVFDLQRDKLLFNTYVAHGRNSGNVTAHDFSNVPSSKMSSLGTYITRDTYYGHKGYSLNLQGVDKGFNDNALSRRVVIHGAWYVEPSFIKSTGRAGLSWGCPAVSDKLAKPLINAIKGGSVVFAYYPDPKFMSRSKYVVA